MLLISLLLAAISLKTAIAVPIEKRQFPYGSTPVRGADIGGWLVLEPWITPSIFQQFPDGNIVDEYTLCQQVPNAEEILQSHWSTWTGLGDFEYLASSGFNLVRIPIGYWAFQKYDGDPYIMGAADYLNQAIGWARQTGLKVWIDLHGAPLSQNGFDNSGRRQDVPLWTTADTVSFTEGVIGQIAKTYGPGYEDVIAGIELLNEPEMGELVGGRGATEDYYSHGFQIVRDNGNTPVVIHDGFATPSSWNGFLSGQGGAIIDHHEYQVFTDAFLSLSPEEHAATVCSQTESFATGQDKTLIVGEWTAAMTDCAAAVNGYGIGARYDGTYSKRNADGSYTSSTYIGSCASINYIDQWTEYNKQTTTNFIRAQIDAYEQMTQGWIFWTFKTEASAEWDLFRLMQAGVFPNLKGYQSSSSC